MKKCISMAINDVADDVAVQGASTEEIDMNWNCLTRVWIGFVSLFVCDTCLRVMPMLHGELWRSDVADDVALLCASTVEIVTWLIEESIGPC